MIAKSYILKNLDWLDKQYTTSRNQRASLLYSKLAIIELCGWIEESMDALVSQCSKRRVKSEKYKEHISTQCIERNYGFEYEKHFRNMLVQVVGFTNFEKLESSMDAAKLQRLKSVLGSLKSIRNKVAHTHVKGTTQTISAPSVTKNQFLQAYEGLQEFERVLKTLKM